MRIALVGVCAYASLVALLRISGKRTLSKMNAFDFIVTVALGSTLATVLLSKDTPLAEGVLALGVLILLQFVITWSSVRWRVVDHVVKSEPRLLVHKGLLLRGAMKAERVSEGEVFQAMRSHGVSALEEVEAVVLETDGRFSVVPRSSTTPGAALTNITGAG